MKKLHMFSRVWIPILFAAFIVLILLGGFITQAMFAAESPSASQALLAADTPSDGKGAAAKEAPSGNKGKGKTKPCPPEKGPAGCSATDVTPGAPNLPPGCTSGTYCNVAAGTKCGAMGMFRCVTVNQGGVCNCSCQ